MKAIICILAFAVSLSASTPKLIIEQNDGSTKEVNITDVNTLSFGKSNTYRMINIWSKSQGLKSINTGYLTVTIDSLSTDDPILKIGSLGNIHFSDIDSITFNKINAINGVEYREVKCDFEGFIWNYKIVDNEIDQWKDTTIVSYDTTNEDKHLVFGNVQDEYEFITNCYECKKDFPIEGLYYCSYSFEWVNYTLCDFKSLYIYLNTAKQVIDSIICINQNKYSSCVGYYMEDETNWVSFRITLPVAYTINKDSSITATIPLTTPDKNIKFSECSSNSRIGEQDETSYYDREIINYTLQPESRITITMKK